jgi:putative nucleotidyltransferase with HDIG domain
MASEPVRRGSTPPRPSRPLAHHGARAGLAVVLAVFTYVLFPASPAVDFPIYEIGAVASDNVIAPFAFRVLKNAPAIEKERADVARAVEPVYDFVPAALDSTRRLLDGFKAAVTSAARAAPPAMAPVAVQHAATGWGINLTSSQASYLASEPRRAALLDVVGRVFDRWLAAGVASSGALDTISGAIILRVRGEERRMPADSVPTFNVLVSRARLVHPDPASPVANGVYLRLLGTFFRPTVVPNAAATQLRRDEARRAVSTARYEVRAGEKIIGANEVVGREEFEKMRALHDAVDKYRATQRGVRRAMGAVLFNFLLVALLGITVAVFRPRIYASFRSLALVAVVGAIVLVGAALVAQLRPIRAELIPVALAAVLLSALFDRGISVVAAMVLATLVAGQSVFRGTNALFINLVGAAVAAIGIGSLQRRNQSYRWIVTIATAYVATAIAISLTLDQPTREMFVSAGFGVINAVLSVVIALLLLPMAEAFTGIETDLTLLEWSDLNRPLMQRLSLEAPGTYAHTIAIANLADVACRAIGANPLLARVGAYYHDIGKIARPQFFVENQAKDRNPHDALAPGASAQIIRDHVREGLALAEQYRLPHALRAFITEHHGTGAISYFLDKARTTGEFPINAGDYAYPGPLPRSAETAVVMLADGVEAATRVLHDPTPQKIRDVVDHIVKQRMEQGQLNEAPLTLAQIGIVKDQFARVLAGMYHNRVDYPASSGGVTSEFASA